MTSKHKAPVEGWKEIRDNIVETILDWGKSRGELACWVQDELVKAESLLSQARKEEREKVVKKIIEESYELIGECHDVTDHHIGISKLANQILEAK